MRKVIILHLLTLSFSLAGCGREESARDSVGNKLKLPDRAALLNALHKSNVICGEEDLECPNNVAKVVFWEKEGDVFSLGVCSGTLIEEEYILTNSHCIPSNLKTNSSCDSQILIQFPKTKTSRAENLDCISVVQVYDYKKNKEPDLAVIKIQRSTLNNYNAASILNNDFQNKKKVYAYTMNPGGAHDPYLGTIMRKNCNVLFDNIIKYNSSAGDKEFLLSGDECNLIGGNSGSGLFNEQGNLIGIVHKKIESSILEQVFTEAYIPFEKLTNMGMATNLACLSSLTSASGYSCGPSKKELTLDEYISLKKKEFSLEHLEDSNIEAIVTSSLELKLFERREAYNPFATLRWVKAQMKSIGGVLATQVIVGD